MNETHSGDQANKTVVATSSVTDTGTTTTPPITDQTDSQPKIKPIRTAKRIPVVPLNKQSDKETTDGFDTNTSDRNGSDRSTSDRNNSDRNNSDRSGSDRNTVMITGYLDNSRDGHGVIRNSLCGEDEMDAYIATSQIKKLRLLPGDIVTGPARAPKDNERFLGMIKVDSVNGLSLEELRRKQRVQFQKLTPVYPDSLIKLEMGAEPLDLRIIDMVAPIGKGQRSLIVSPPKAGKTTLMKNIASGVATNHPEIHIMAVLVGERPEEVTDIKRHIERITKGKG